MADVRQHSVHAVLIRAILLLFSLHAARCLAAGPSLAVNSPVSAGQPIEVSYCSGPGSGASNQAPGAQYFELYLVASLEEAQSPASIGPQCMLRYSLPIDDHPFDSAAADPYRVDITGPNTTVNVTIPADVGPSGSYYALWANVAQQIGSPCGPIQETYALSNVFELSGSTGDWNFNTDKNIWDLQADMVPCDSVGCVRTCADSLQAQERRCIQTCPDPQSMNCTDPCPDYQECLNNCPGMPLILSNTDSNGNGSFSSGLPGASARPGHSGHPGHGGPPRPPVCTQSSTTTASMPTMTNGWWTPASERNAAPRSQLPFAWFFSICFLMVGLG